MKFERLLSVGGVDVLVDGVGLRFVKDRLCDSYIVSMLLQTKKYQSCLLPGNFLTYKWYYLSRLSGEFVC